MNTPLHPEFDPASDPASDIEIDARGLLCPLPVLRARKVLLGLREGARVVLIATDAASWLDVPHFCAQSGHQLLWAQDQDGERRYLIARGPDPDPSA